MTKGQHTLIRPNHRGVLIFGKDQALTVNLFAAVESLRLLHAVLALNAATRCPGLLFLALPTIYYPTGSCTTCNVEHLCLSFSPFL